MLSAKSGTSLKYARHPSRSWGIPGGERRDPERGDLSFRWDDGFVAASLPQRVRRRMKPISPVWRERFNRSAARIVFTPRMQLSTSSLTST